MKLLFMFLSLLHLSAGDPRLVCPETVETRIGGDVVLPCHLEPEENIQYGKVEVTKVDLDALVYAYYNGEQVADYYEPYKHRTSLNIEELKNGVVNVKISSVRESDKGKYRIYIDTWRINSIVNLVVGNPLLVCQETVEARIGLDLVLSCHVEPKQSIEDDEVECRRSNLDDLVYACRNGEQLANYEDQYKHRTYVNIEELKNGVLNLTISSVTQSDNGTFNIYIHTWGIMSKVNLVVGNPLLVCQETVEAQISDNVTLPCHMEPKQSIEDKTITCRRAVSEVLVYAPRTKELLANYQYRHRTSVNIEELKIGVLNLKIFSVRKSDNGTFNIYIPKWRINSIVTLIVVDPPSRDRLGVIVVVLVVVLCVIVWILVKRRKIRTGWRKMMMKRRAQMTEHEDEDQHVDAGNDHLDPGQRERC